MTEQTWYCFRTAPQKERTTKMLLEMAGYSVLLPTEQRPVRRRNWRKKPELREYVQMVGYILIGFDGVVNWNRMLGRGRERTTEIVQTAMGDQERAFGQYSGWGHLLLSVVGHEGRPIPLRPDAMGEIERMCGQIVPCKTSHNTRASILEGELVRVTSGGFKDWEGRVEQIRDGKGMIPARLFNRDIIIAEPLENLEAA